MSFSYPSKDRALLGAYDLDGRWEEFGLYIEAPNGARIEQHEIAEWCQNRFQQLKNDLRQRRTDHPWRNAGGGTWSGFGRPVTGLSTTRILSCG
jgi:hypothetical protein